MSKRAATATRSGTLVALVGVALAPLASRSALLVDRLVAPALPDLRGLASDVLVSLLAFVALAAASRRSRLVALPLVAIWVGLHTVNYETVATLGALASVFDASYLGDPTFLAGSALAPSRPVLFGLVLLISLAAVAFGMPRVSWRGAALSALAAAPLFGLTLALPFDDAVAVWRQTDFLQHNARVLARGGHAPEAGHRDPAAAMLDLVPSLRADLSGRAIAALPGRARNVLLVVLESVSGAYVERLAADHGRRAAVAMPRLDAEVRTGLAFSTFITHQRKTNRGLYGILCGELPNLLPRLPKMSAYPARGGRDCLPRILAGAGYATAYLQAAPLAFMLKNQFMPRSGFDRVLGHESFDRHYARNVWGVDDRAFFETAVGLVDELRAGTAPWFLTLLNVGTHHPFVIPEDFLPEEPSRMARAMAYLDGAFGAFVSALRERGVLEDTLVVVTSDESLGIQEEGDAVAKALSQNWGVLLVLGPDLPSRVEREPAAQMDVALSILDYLGLAERGSHLFGRSVFRHYGEPRPIFFANTNLLAVGEFEAEGGIVLCREDTGRCGRYAPAGGRIFAPGPSPLAYDPERHGLAREVARRSVASDAAEPGRRDFDLIGNRRIVVEPGEPLVLHGGQFIDVEPGEWVSVDLVIEVRTDGGEAEIHHKLKGPRPPAAFVSTVRVHDGDTFRVKYTYAPKVRRRDLQCHTLARIVTGSRLELHIQRGELSIHRGGNSPGQGLVVEHDEVVPGS